MRGGFLKTEKDGHGIETDGGFVGNFFESLPEGFVANALALTSPMDVCRLSLVCSVFRSAAEWDAVWEKFLPPEYQKISTEAEGGGGSASSGSKKEMYLRLCDHPVIIDDGNKSFSLDKRTGKKCYMLAPRDLSIIWGGTPRYWRWISMPESRFSEVAELRTVCWLEVRGRINTSILSTNILYASYLVYKPSSDIYGFDTQPVEVSIRVNGGECKTKSVFLDPEASRLDNNVGPGRRTGIFNRLRWMGTQSSTGSAARLNGPRMRVDGWLEIELGEYINERGEEGELEMSIMEVKGGNWKGGIVIQGIEIRPKGF
ncbi:hypothetical protein LXL04_014996 [Taraxacum kok-saghyz]